MDFLWQLFKRLLAWLHGSSTGLIGLALTLACIGFFRSRNNNNNNSNNRRLSQPREVQQAPRRSSRVAAGGQSSGSVQQEDQQGDAAPPTVERAGGRSSRQAKGTTPQSKKLQGLHCITLSVPGVLLEEREVVDSATVLGADTLSLVQEMCSSVRVYMIAHVSDDIGQAVVAGALEAAGLLGVEPTQLPPQRLLFCSTQSGKQSMVRQIEPDLHVDADWTTVEELRRFVPQALWVNNGEAVAASRAASGPCAASLLEFFKNR